MREGSYDKPVPEVALLRSIVRRFIDVANAVKSVSSRIPPSPSATAASSSATGLGDSKDISALLRLIEGHADSDDLVGWASAYRGIFLLRCASALLSLVAFVVMSNVHPLLIGAYIYIHTAEPPTDSCYFTHPSQAGLAYSPRRCSLLCAQSSAPLALLT